MPTRLHPFASHGIPGVEMFRVERGSPEDSLRIEVSPTPASWPGGVRDSVEARWATMLAENPRLYSGPLLAVVSIDREEGIIHTVRDEFKRLAVQPQVKTGVQILSVTGVITARDNDGSNHVLLGRRGRTTRVYGGMWELGPAGGIPPPHASTTTITEADAARHVLEEAEEELGLTLDASRLAPVRLLVRDTIAHSDDLNIVIPHDEPGSLERLQKDLNAARATQAWEYEETRWVALEPHDPNDPNGIAAFDHTHADEIIITTRATFRGMGWIR